VLLRKGGLHGIQQQVTVPAIPGQSLPSVYGRTNYAASPGSGYSQYQPLYQIGPLCSQPLGYHPTLAYTQHTIRPWSYGISGSRGSDCLGHQPGHVWNAERIGQQLRPAQCQHPGSEPPSFVGHGQKQGLAPHRAKSIAKPRENDKGSWTAPEGSPWYVQSIHLKMTTRPVLNYTLYIIQHLAPSRSIQTDSTPEVSHDFHAFFIWSEQFLYFHGKFPLFLSYTACSGIFINRNNNPGMYKICNSAMVRREEHRCAAFTSGWVYDHLPCLL
jgi:hypothetical protein